KVSGDLGQTNDAETSYPSPGWCRAAVAFVLKRVWWLGVRFLPDLLTEDPLRIKITNLFDDETSTRQILAGLRTMPLGHPVWVPYCEAHRLLEEPGAQALAATLRSCVARGYDPA